MMELYCRRKPDSEYIAWVRKQVGHGKRYAIFHGIMSVVSIVLFLMLNHLVFQFCKIMPEVAETLPHGVIIGLPLGVMLIFFVAMAGANAVMAARHLKGNRTDNLMLTFHDELKQKESFQQDCSTVSSEGAPSEEP
jgi:hypothetical protein